MSVGSHSVEKIVATVQDEGVHDNLKDTPLLASPVNGNRVRRRFWCRTDEHNLDAVATQRSVFDDPVTLELYRPPQSYENTHRFDPNARWTFREERVRCKFCHDLPLVDHFFGLYQQVVRKIDLKIMLWAFVMFFALDLDRSNILQANTDNFLEDLHLTTNDFNFGNSLFRLAFLSAELPSQLVSKRVGPDVWVPSQVCSPYLPRVFAFTSA
jgi:hypothetical protein